MPTDPSPEVTERSAEVWGSPVAHSLSPVLHRAAYDALGLADWRYRRRAVGGPGEPSVAEALRLVDDDCVGVSVTMPGKEAALAVADTSTERARLVGAANTLVRTPEGWRADSTDAVGLAGALAQAKAPRVGEALVLGSGATARSVCAALAERGVTTVVFAVREGVRPETAEVAAGLGLALDTRPLGDLPSYAAGFPLIVSTLPTGTDLGLPPDGAGAPGPGGLLVDVVYGGWPTPLARWAAAAGTPVQSGLEMLLHQAAEQVRLMTGCEAPLEAMRSALAEATAPAPVRPPG